jgi:tetratricopeptide (TPR) repeat protein
MKNLLTISVLALVLAVGCGTPREKSDALMRSAVLTYQESDKLNADMQKSTTSPAQIPTMQKEIEVKNDKALKLMEEAIATDPTNLAAYNNYGKMAQAFGYIEDALPAFKKGLEKMPPPPYSNDSLKNLYNEFNNSLRVCYIRLNRPDSALYHSEKIKESFPSFYAVGLYNWAYKLYSDKKYKESIEQFNIALAASKEAIQRSQQPEVLANFRNIAVYIEQAYKFLAPPPAKDGELPKLDKPTIETVLKTYQDAMAGSPSNLATYQDYMRFCDEYNNYDLGIKAFKEFATKNPTNAKAQEQVALTLYNAGKNGEADPFAKKYKELTGKEVLKEKKKK